MTYDNGQTDPLMQELKEAAFEYLLLNPGSDFGDWQQGMIEQYPTEVVDALGSNPEEVFADLADLWDSDYLDSKTDVEQKFCEWAEAFATESAVNLYYRLVDVCSELTFVRRKKSSVNAGSSGHQSHH